MMDKINRMLKIKGPLPEGFDITVRAGHKADGEQIKSDNKGRYSLGKGIYSVLFEAEGYFSEERIIQIDEDGPEDEIIIEIHPIQLTRCTAGFKGTLFRFSDELEDALYNDKVAGYAEGYIHDTPAFDSGKGPLCFTTTDECYGYLNHVERNNEKIRVFDLEGLPVVIVSEIVSECTNISECISRMKSSGYLNVFYQAQVHGTEPVSGEAALAFIGAVSKGDFDDQLKKINLMIVPRSNPEGSDQFDRKCRGIDINRDALSLKCRETKVLHDLFIDLMPHVTIDSHTFTKANSLKEDKLDRSVLDIRISPANSQNIDLEVSEISGAMASEVIRQARGCGIRAGYYGDSADPTTSRGFYGAFNTCSFLLESEGTRSDKRYFSRNVWCQLSTVKKLLSIIEQNVEHIKTIVDDARTRCCKESMGDIFVLKHDKSDDDYFKTAQPAYDHKGRVQDKEHIIYFPKRNVTVKKTDKPFAYILSKAVPEHVDAVELLRKHKIYVEEIDGLTHLNAAQYCISNDVVTICEEKLTCFEQGAFMIPVNQVSSNIVCTLLEPDSSDAGDNNGSLVQQGIITVDSENKLNIYRTTSFE